MRPVERVIIICKQCTAEFPAYPRANRMFCSRQCRAAFQRGTNHSRWITDRKRICKFCAVEFQTIKGWEREKKFCSHECAIAWRHVNGFPRELPIGTVVQCLDGYKLIKLADGSWASEHRVVMERVLDRELMPFEVVHHRDGNHGNNEPHNLEAVSRQRHMELHAEAERLGLAIIASRDWLPTIEGMAC